MNPTGQGYRIAIIDVSHRVIALYEAFACLTESKYSVEEAIGILFACATQPDRIHEHVKNFVEENACLLDEENNPLNSEYAITNLYKAVAVFCMTLVIELDRLGLWSPGDEPDQWVFSDVMHDYSLRIKRTTSQFYLDQSQVSSPGSRRPPTFNGPGGFKPNF